jgi:hypothetical protein
MAGTLEAAAGMDARSVFCAAGLGVEIRGVDVRAAGVGSGVDGVGTVNLACTF